MKNVYNSVRNRMLFNGPVIRPRKSKRLYASLSGGHARSRLIDEDFCLKWQIAQDKIVNSNVIFPKYTSNSLKVQVKELATMQSTP